jgi:hypothetical protein
MRQKSAWLTLLTIRETPASHGATPHKVNRLPQRLTHGPQRLQSAFFPRRPIGLRNTSASERRNA